MIYSRHHLDKLGIDLIGDDPFKRAAALSSIQKWRETHLFVLQKLYGQLLSFFKETGITYELSSMRIKRMTSIEAKLRNNQERGMKLGGLQDIGGMRFVFEDIGQLDKVSMIMDSFKPNAFTLSRYNDYVSSPKESGYRSIHYVFKYSSSDERYDGISIELQLRTILQHSWAMAVETASLISQTTLKADLKDDSEWRGFFKLVSALFANEEHKPVYHTFSDYSLLDFCKEYYHYENSRLTDQLKALRVTSTLDFEGIKSGYCVLTIDFIKRVVYARAFKKEDGSKATLLFGNIEQSINQDEAALMVAIEDIKEIKDAYPSYFLDTKKFLQFLEEFDNKCKLTGYKE